MPGVALGTQAARSPRCAGCLVGLCRSFTPSSLASSLVRERKGFLSPEGVLPECLAGEGSVLQEGKRALCTDQAQGRWALRCLG